jgi:hypothetical protein
MDRLKARLFSQGADFLSALGLVVYLVQSAVYARSQASLLDEGAYLLKGYLFVTGQYFPYQDYGPWTNHMPLAFLIPGLVQRLFVPGLGSGRLLSILWGVLMLLGLWILVRRLAGRYWAVFAVWSVALNPALIKLYSLANSQSLVACMLVWILVWVLGEERTVWHLLAGSLLAGVLWMTRINMAPVLLLLVGYIIWQYGWKAGIASALVGGLPILIGHAVFFPNILRVWAHWLPADLLPFLKPFAHPPGSDPSWNPPVTLEMRLLSFWQGVRFHFVYLVGALSAGLFWQSKRKWQNLIQYKMVVFLLLLFAVLFLAHLWAALGNDYCVYCFGVYLSFFSWMGILILAVSFSQWRRHGSVGYDVLVLGLILVISMGIWASAHAEGFGRAIFQDAGRAALKSLEVKVPHFEALPGESGSVELRTLLQNKWALSSESFERSVLRGLALLAGCLFAILVFLSASVIATMLERNARIAKRSLGWVGLVGFLAIGFALSPTSLLGGGFHTYDCSGDVIRSYEAAGKHLAEVIPAGAWVYWRGGDSAVPLLYLPGVRLFPAQINGDYSYRLGGEADALARYGFWSEELAHQWAERADFILIEESEYRGWLADYVEGEDFDELAPTPPTEPCRPGSAIHIFRRMP